jgi:mRNA interferase MazF
MVNKNYKPKYGDIIWLDLDPTLGHEQKGRRPALVISASKFNLETNLAYVCPITSVKKDYFYRVELVDQKTSGFVMADQIKSVSWKERKSEFIEKINTETLKSIINLIEVVIEPSL